MSFCNFDCEGLISISLHSELKINDRFKRLLSSDYICISLTVADFYSNRVIFDLENKLHEKGKKFLLIIEQYLNVVSF